MPEGKTAILVVTCDNYSDLWDPFFECLHRFWPDCPFRVYLLSNNKKCERDGVTNVLSGDDISWSDSLIRGVRQVEEDYVMLIHEDLFLCRNIDTKKVSDIFAWAIESGANYIRMNPMINKADKPFNSSVGIISEKSIYRTSNVLALWKKTLLLELLKAGESAWDFENHGSVRSNKYDKFYAALEDNFPIINTVVRGKWQGSAVRKCKSLGIKIDLSSRGVMSFKEDFGYSLKTVRSYILRCFPAKYRNKIKKLMLK